MNGRRLGGSLRIRAVSFDVGGTLIEPWPSVGHVYAQVAAEHGWPGLPVELLNRQFAAAWKALSNFQHTRTQWSALVDETFRGLIATPPSRSFFPAVYERFDQAKSWRIYGDVVPTVKALRSRGFRLAVISNWDERLRPLLRALGLIDSFEQIIVSCEAGHCKPAPQIFAAASAKLALPPAAILHVGDSLEMDVRGARAAGMAAVYLRRQTGGEDPKSEIRNPKEGRSASAQATADRNPKSEGGGTRVRPLQEALAGADAQEDEINSLYSLEDILVSSQD